MKTFPSIRQSRKSFQAFVFDKLDGSNLRISWDTKKGWYELATRTRSVPTDHVLYGKGYEYFLAIYAEELASIASRQGWKRLDAFFEFHGPRSFAGRHDLEDQHVVTLIDLTPNTRGFLFPQEFMEFFGHLPTAAFLGEAQWGEDYAEAVRRGEISGISFEGVVAKAVDKNRRAKAKTQAWIDRVKREFGAEEAAKIIKS